MSYQRKQLHPFPPGVVESLMKRKDLPEWQANIEGINMKGNELVLSCPFGGHFTRWLNVTSSDLMGMMLDRKGCRPTAMIQNYHRHDTKVS